jgi:hypothetical protein
MIDGISIIDTDESKICFADVELEEGHLHLIEILYVER